jgi:hypothetical protein
LNVGNEKTVEVLKDGLDSLVMSYTLFSQTEKVVKFVGIVGH